MSEFLSDNYQFLVMKFSIYLNRRVFVMRNVGHVLNIPFNQIREGNNQFCREKQLNFFPLQNCYFLCLDWFWRTPTYATHCSLHLSVNLDKEITILQMFIVSHCKILLLSPCFSKKSDDIVIASPHPHPVHPSVRTSVCL